MPTKVNENYWYSDLDFENLIKKVRDEDEQNGIFWQDPIAKGQEKIFGKSQLEYQLEYILKDKKVNKKGNKILFPYNAGDHWVGVIVELNGKDLNVSFLDSMRSTIRENVRLTVFKEELRVIKNNLKRGGYNLALVDSKTDIAQQQDKAACGPYTFYNLRNAAYGENREGKHPYAQELRKQHISLYPDLERLQFDENFARSNQKTKLIVQKSLVSSSKDDLKD